MLKHILLASLFAAPAFAFELRTNANNGDIVRWKSKVEFTIAPNFADALGVPGADEAVMAAVQQVAAQTPNIEVSVRKGEKEPLFGFYYGGGNQNDIMYLEEWPWESSALAATMVTYNAWTNEVQDADIVFNLESPGFRVFEGKAPAGELRYDVQNTITHELGHALGLMHNQEDELAVMYPSSAPGETSKRKLASDDIAGLAELYGKVQETEPTMGCSATASAPMWLVNLGLLLAFRRKAKVAALAAAVTAAAAIAAEPVRTDVRAEPEEISWGEVVNTNSRWVPDSKMIVTELEVQVQRCVKGTCADQRVKLVVPGGQVGEIVQVIDHHPSVKRGSQVVLTKRSGHVKMVVAR